MPVFLFAEKTIYLYYTLPNDYLVNNLLKIQIGINPERGFKNMEHSFAGALAALLLTGTIVSGFYALENFSDPEETELSAETEISASEKSEPEKVLLGVFEGKLALFAGESPYPNIVYDFYVRNLPEEDQNRLFEGISVFSQSELESLLEDFMS